MRGKARRTSRKAFTGCWSPTRASQRSRPRRGPTCSPVKARGHEMLRVPILVRCSSSARFGQSQACVALGGMLWVTRSAIARANPRPRALGQASVTRRKDVDLVGGRELEVVPAERPDPALMGRRDQVVIGRGMQRFTDEVKKFGLRGVGRDDRGGMYTVVARPHAWSSGSGSAAVGSGVGLAGTMPLIP